MIGNDLTKGNVTKTLLGFTMPFMFANILHTLYGIVDLFIVGRFTDSVQMSAVSIGSLVMMMVNFLVMGFGNGGTVVTGQLCGAKREEDLREAVSTVFCIVPVISVVIMAIGLLLCSPLLNIINTPPESFTAAKAYLRICLVGLIFTGMFTSIASVLRGMGDSKGPTIFISISCVANIIGDLFCVKTLQMGAAGAALATTVSQGLSVVIGYFYLRSHNFPFDFRPKSFRIYPDKLRQLLRIGIPSALQDALISSSFLVLEAIINGMGFVATAAAGVADRLFSVATVPAMAFSTAISAMVAQNTGAGEYQRGRKCLRIGTVFSGIVGVLIFLIMAFAPAACIGLFTEDTEVIRNGVDYMTYYKFDMLLCSFAFCITGYINGTGHTRYTLAMNVVGSIAVRLPVVWIISRMAGATLRQIGLGLPTASVVQLIMGVAFLLFAKSEREQRAKLLSK